MVASTLRLNKVKVSCEVKDFGLAADYRDPYGRSIDPHFSCLKTDREVSLRTEQVFPSRLLRYMEQAFENMEYGYRGSPTKRLHDIYQNLVKNKGKRFTWRDDNKTVVYQVKS